MQEIFDKFYNLVRIYYKESREVIFYADKLCITPNICQRLSRIVQDAPPTTGYTIMYWPKEAPAKTMIFPW